MAMFEAYGALSGDAGVPLLDKILNERTFLGKREDPELRACAAMALGRIGTDKATESLRKSANEKEVIVRNAVSKALRGGSAQS
jgi:HEAT repeat protein